MSTLESRRAAAQAQADADRIPCCLEKGFRLPGERFAIGDKVRLKRGNMLYPVGTVAEIEYSYDQKYSGWGSNPRDYSIIGPDGSTHAWNDENHLEFVDDPPPMTRSLALGMMAVRDAMFGRRLQLTGKAPLERLASVDDMKNYSDREIYWFRRFFADIREAEIALGKDTTETDRIIAIVGAVP